MTSNNRKLTDFFTVSSSPSMSPSPRTTATHTLWNAKGRKSSSVSSSQKSQLSLGPRPLTRPGTSNMPIEISSAEGDTSIEVLAPPPPKEARTRRNKMLPAGIGSKSRPVELADTSSDSASPMAGPTLKNTPIILSSDSDAGFVSTHLVTRNVLTRRGMEGLDVDNISSGDENEVHISLSPFCEDGSSTDFPAMHSTVNHNTMDWEPTPSPPSSRPHRSPVKNPSFLPTPEKTSPDSSAADIKGVMLEPIVASRSSRFPSTPPSSSVSPPQAPTGLETFPDKIIQDSTARIIARIKAEAKARVQSEDEGEEMSLSIVPVVETSDDDELDALDLGFNVNAKPKPRRSSPSADMRAAAARTMTTSSSLTSSSDGEAIDADCSSLAESIHSYPRRSTRTSGRVSEPSRSSSPDPLTLGSSVSRRFTHNSLPTRAKPSAFEQLLLEETRKRKKAGGAKGSALAAKLADEAFNHESDSDSHPFGIKRPGGGSDRGPHRVTGKDKSAASRGPPPSTPHRRRTRSQIVESETEDNSISADTPTSSDSESNIDDNGETRNEDDHQQSANRKFLGNDTEWLHDIMTSDRAVRRGLATSRAATDGSRRFWMKTSEIAHQVQKNVPLAQEVASDPLIRGICDAIKNNRSLDAAILLDRWKVYPGKADLSTTRAFAVVLLDIVVSTTDYMCRSAAMRCLVSLVHDDSYSPSDLRLDFKNIVIQGFGKLGAKRDALEALQSVGANYPQGVIMPTPLIIRKDHRVHATLSLFNILGSLAMSKFGVVDFPDLVLLVLLVASHRSSPPEVSRGASACISDWLEMESVTLHVQREICRNIIRATSDWSVRQKSHILECIPQSSASAARLLSWTAYGMLIPREMEKATLERYVNPPPLSRLLEHLFAKNSSKEEMDPSELNSTERLFDLGEADKPPNYVDIMYQAEILSNMLCDVRALVEFEYKHGLAHGSSFSSMSGTNAVNKSPSKAKARQMTPLEILCEGLESKHDRIVDTRAADMDRTKAKDVIQRLRMRLLYQRRSALEVISYANGTAARGKLEAHFVPPSTINSA